MRLTEIQYDGARPFQGYGPGFFRIDNRVIEGPVLVSPRGVEGWGGLEDDAPLLALAGQIDVLLIGMGAAIAHPPEALRRALDACAIGLEPMDTPAAARSYNILLSEGRRVAAAALPV